MDDGTILYGLRDGTLVLRLTGAVLYTSGHGGQVVRSLDRFISGLEGFEFTHVVVDLTGATSMDSTTLGLLARLVVLARVRSDDQPVLIVSCDDIDRTVRSVSLDRVYSIVTAGGGASEPAGLDAIPQAPALADPEDAMHAILAAHRALVALDASNGDAFSDAIALLEAEVDALPRP